MKKSAKRIAFDKAVCQLSVERQEEVLAFVHQWLFAHNNPNRTVTDPSHTATILPMRRRAVEGELA